MKFDICPKCQENMNSHYCQNCGTEYCSDCGDEIPLGDFVTVTGTAWLCGKCAARSFFGKSS